LIFNEGQILDASFLRALRERNTRVLKTERAIIYGMTSLTKKQKYIGARWEKRRDFLGL
jgi:hypothetical protein